MSVKTGKIPNGRLHAPTNARAASDRDRTRQHRIKLSPAEREQLAVAYLRGLGTMKELAREAKISQPRVSQIVAEYRARQEARHDA